MAKISTFAMHTAYLLGFRRIADVRGVPSIVSLFKNSMILSGIYLQIRPNRELYIGQTANLPARFERHLAHGAVIEELAFMPMHPKYLDDKEKELIVRAERLGLELNNLALRTQATQARPRWEALYPQDWVQAWLTPRDDNNRTFRSVYLSMHSGLRNQLDLSKAHPAWPQILPIGKFFVKNLIAKPQESAGHFWSADAYTKRLGDSFLPLIRIHAGGRLLLSLGVFKQVNNEAWGYLHYPREKESERRAQEMAERYPYLKADKTDSDIIIQTSAKLLVTIFEEEKYFLRSVFLNVMKSPLLHKGNPALQYLLSS